jgi:hypothetical protein
VGGMSTWCAHPDVITLDGTRYCFVCGDDLSRFSTEHIDDSDICEDCNERHAGVCQLNQRAE